MSGQFPHRIDVSAFPAIRENSAALELVATTAGGDAWSQFKADVSSQEHFLTCFRKTFSVAMSCRMANITPSKYRQWRDNSILFAEAVNEAIDLWLDKLLSSAMQRAVVYHQEDKDTESGYIEDADGNPVYFNANDRMATTMLKAGFPGYFDDRVLVDDARQFKGIEEGATLEDATTRYLALVGHK